MKYALSLCLYLSVAACTSGPYPVSSAYFQIPSGSLLILKQSLTIAPNSGRVYIQYGKVVSDKEKDQYYPHCWFVSWFISEKKTIIKPDRFVITAAKKDENFVNYPKPLFFASSNIILISGGSYGASAIEYSTELTLQSDIQADIRELVCSHWEDPADANHLTIAQINQTLGDIAELQLP